MSARELRGLVERVREARETARQCRCDACQQCADARHEERALCTAMLTHHVWIEAVEAVEWVGQTRRDAEAARDPWVNGPAGHRARCDADARERDAERLVRALADRLHAERAGGGT